MNELQWGSPRWFIINLIIAAVYIGTGELSDTLSSLSSQASPIWAPSGVMVAAVLIFGYRVFPGILFGTIAINVRYFSKHSPKSYWPASLGFALFSALESLSCAWLLKNPLSYKNGCFHWKESRDGTVTVDTLNDALWLFLVAPFTAFIAGTGNAIVLVSSRLSTWNHFMDIWPTWVLGDLSAILCYMPCILHIWNLWHQDFNTFCWGRRKPVKACLLSQLKPTSEIRSLQRGCKSCIDPYSLKCSSPGDEHKIQLINWERSLNIRTDESTGINRRENTTVPVNRFIGNYCSKCKERFSVYRSSKGSRANLDNQLERGSQHWVEDVSRAKELPIACSHDPDIVNNQLEVREFSIQKFLMRLAECTVLFLLLVGLCMLIFFNIGASANDFVQHLSYLVFPIVIWASFRFNRVGLPLSVVVVAVIASSGTAHKHGPLYHSSSTDNSLLQVQMFVGVLAMVAITLAAIVHDRKEMEGELNEMNSTLESQVEIRTKELEMANVNLRKSQAAAEEASKAKSEFLANMSHEIRTPIHGIIGMTSLALDTNLTDEQREHLETVAQSAECLLHIVNAILDLAKIEAGRLELEHVPFSLSGIIGSTMKMLQVRANQKHLDLSWEVGPDVPLCLIGDAGRLQQCILNLVGNAIKFTHAGSVALSANLYMGNALEDFGIKGSNLCRKKYIDEKRSERGHSRSWPSKCSILSPGKKEVNRILSVIEGYHGSEYCEHFSSDAMKNSRALFSDTKDLSAPASTSNDVIVEKVTLLFSVSDTGIGISKENQKEIFKAFSQADSSTTRLYGGTGLGLSIVERLVGMMGGRIWLKSELGTGSTFYFIACFDKGDPSSLENGSSENASPSADDGFTEALVNQSIIHRSSSLKCRKTQPDISTQSSTSGNGLLDDENRLVIDELAIETHENNRDDLASNTNMSHYSLNNGTNGHSKQTGVLCQTFTAAVSNAPDSNNQRLVFKGIKVLLAEDNLVNQKVACQQLKKFGTEVDVVSDGQQCINALQNGRDKYDLILMDVQMPVLDGLQATKIIRANEQEFGFSRKPIIGLTAHAIQGYKDKCLEAGMDAYACKPFQAKQLLEVIQTVMQH